MNILGILDLDLDPDPHENLCGSETLILSCVRWQKFLPNNLKGAVKYIIWMRKNREFCQILKYFYPKPSKNIFIISAGVFGFDRIFFFTVFGLTRPGNSG